MTQKAPQEVRGVQNAITSITPWLGVTPSQATYASPARSRGVAVKATTQAE